MIETRRLKNVFNFYPNDFKFCAVKENYKYDLSCIIRKDGISFSRIYDIFSIDGNER